MNSSHTDTEKLPVWKTVGESYRLTLFNLSALIRISWPWLIILVGGGAVLYWTMWPLEAAARENGNGASSIASIISMLFSFCVGAAIAVPWHRYILLGEAPAEAHPLRLDARIVRYAICGFCFAAAELTPIVLMRPAPSDVHSSAADAEFATWFSWFVLSQIAFAIMIYLTTRLWLILPSIALGRDDINLSRVWQASRGNFWRIFIGSIAALLISLLPLFAILIFALAPLSRLSYTAQNCAYDLLAMLGGMTYVTFLSLAYRHFFGPFEQQT